VKPLPDAQTILCDATSLDDFVHRQGLAKIDILKIDTEGYEVECLKGAQETLRRTDRIVLEYHSFDLRDEVMTILENSGFFSLTGLPPTKWGMAYFVRA
jgi:hypothetical protein